MTQSVCRLSFVVCPEARERAVEIMRVLGIRFIAAALASLVPLLSFSVAAAEVPVVREADVVVVGGTSAGVGAAIAAHALGARVFLIAPRPYLGEDIAGTMRVVRDPADRPIARCLCRPSRARPGWRRRRRRSASSVRSTRRCWAGAFPT